MQVEDVGPVACCINQGGLVAAPIFTTCAAYLLSQHPIYVEALLGIFSGESLQMRRFQLGTRRCA